MERRSERKLAGLIDVAIHAVLVKRKLACENRRFLVYLDEIAHEGQAGLRDYLVVAPKERAEDLITGMAVLRFAVARSV